MAPLVLALVAATGCRFDSALGKTAVVHCTTNAQCPAGLVCQISASRCVTEAQLDLVAPGLSRSTLVLEPKVGSLQPQPTALGVHSHAHWSLVATEPLSADPTLKAQRTDESDEPRITCRLELADPPAFDFGCDVADGTGPDDVLTWQVGLNDVALNAATVALTEHTVLDLTAPPAPRADDAGLEVRDSPWGDEATGLEPSTRVLGPAGSVVEATLVQFRRGTAMLGTASVDSDGGIGAYEVLRSDSPDLIEARAIDPAGNTSAWAPIHGVQWVATFNGKIAGRLFPNPHRFQVSRTLGEGLEGYDVTERGAVDGIDFADGKVALISGAGSWRRLDFAAPEGRMTLPGAAFDQLRSRVVRFGGSDVGLIAGSVWEWSGLDWKLRVPTDPEGDGNPTPRFAPTLVWDAKQRGIVMYGGTSDVPLNDTWLWNGSSWRRLADGPVGPRGLPLMYFDATLDSVVLSGGLDSSRQGLRDAWQLALDGWVPLPLPPFGARAAASVCTEPFTSTTFVFGGDYVGHDTGLWVERDGVWAALPRSGGIEHRFSASCTWDSANNRLVLYGGQLDDGGVSDEVWLLDNSSWVNATPDAGLNPGPRKEHRLVSDPARSTVLMFGDQTGTPATNHVTWKWATDHWEHAFVHTTPPTALVSRTLAWDPARQALRTVGYAAEAPAHLENVWLTTAGWQREPTTLMPSGTGALAFDDVSKSILFATGPAGGHLSLWGSLPDGGWSPIVGDTGLAADSLAAMVPTATTVDFFTNPPGGYATATSFGRAGGITTTSLAPAFYAVATSVQPTGTALVTLEELSKPAKLQIYQSGAVASGPAMPEPLLPVATIGDPFRLSVVVPGGARAGLLTDDTWEYRVASGTWSRMPVADPDSDGQPKLSQVATVGYDLNGHSVVAVENSTAGTGPVWVLQGSTQRPAVFLRFSTATLPKGSHIDSATLVLRAGGSGGDDAGVPGVQVSVRAPGWWGTSATISNASVDQPQVVRVQLENLNGQLVDLIARRLQEIDFAVVPVATNGTGFAQLSVDSAALELHLRR